jgi:hypothetical protein
MTGNLRISAAIGALSIIAVILIHPAILHAELIAFDNFEDYEAGALLDPGGGAGLDGGFGWTSSWRVNQADQNIVSIAEAALRYDHGGTRIDGGGRALHLAGPLSRSIVTLADRRFEPTGEPIYMSLLFASDSATGSRDDDFIQFGLDNRTAHPRMSVGHRVNRDVGDHDFFARATDNWHRSTFTGMGSDELQTHMLVARFSATGGGEYDTVELWVDAGNPIVEPAHATRNLATGLNSVDRFVMRTAFWEEADGYFIDELKIGTDLQSVQAVPEPATVVCLGAALVVSGLNRRKSKPGGSC